MKRAKNGRFLKGVKHPWKVRGRLRKGCECIRIGKYGKHRTKACGYFWVYKPEHPYHLNKGYVYEHRLVMENKLKRYLLPGERVHHIDGNRLNNHPNNLRLFSNHSVHMKEEWKEGNIHSPNMERDKSGRFLGKVMV